MLTGTEPASDERAENKGRRISGRTSAKLWVAAGLAGIVFVVHGSSIHLGRAEVPLVLRLLHFHKSW